MVEWATRSLSYSWAWAWLRDSADSLFYGGGQLGFCLSKLSVGYGLQKEAWSKKSSVVLSIRMLPPRRSEILCLQSLQAEYADNPSTELNPLQYTSRTRSWPWLVIHCLHFFSTYSFNARYDNGCVCRCKLHSWSERFDLGLIWSKSNSWSNSDVYWWTKRSAIFQGESGTSCKLYEIAGKIASTHHGLQDCWYLSGIVDHADCI